MVELVGHELDRFGDGRDRHDGDNDPVVDFHLRDGPGLRIGAAPFHGDHGARGGEFLTLPAERR